MYTLENPHGPRRFGANFAFYLRDDEAAIERAERAVLSRLESLRLR